MNACNMLLVTMEDSKISLSEKTRPITFIYPINRVYFMS